MIFAKHFHPLKVQKHYTHKGKWRKSQRTQWKTSVVAEVIQKKLIHNYKIHLAVQLTNHITAAVFFYSSVSYTMFSDAIRLLWIESQLNLLSSRLYSVSLSTSLLSKIKALLWTFLVPWVRAERAPKCKSTSRILSTSGGSLTFFKWFIWSDSTPRTLFQGF